VYQQRLDGIIHMLPALRVLHDALINDKQPEPAFLMLGIPQANRYTKRRKHMIRCLQAHWRLLLLSIM
jgi:hypothetical protein